MRHVRLFRNIPFRMSVGAHACPKDPSLPMKLTRTCIAAVTTLSLCATAAPAFAAASGGTAPSQAAAQTTAVVQQATGTTGIAPTTAAGAGATAKATIPAPGGAVTVTAPATATGRVSVTAPNGTAITLGLPAATATPGTTSPAGTTVYPGAAPDTSLAVQATTDGGARALVTLDNANAPTSQRFDLGLPADASLRPSDDGGYDVVQTPAGGGVLTLGHIDAPWAKDANGDPVPTHYTLEGTTLVQAVQTSATTAFPVVADPLFTFGMGLYMNMGGAALTATRASAVVVVHGGMVVACSGLAKLPTLISKFLSVACSIGVTPSLMSIVKDVAAAPAGLQASACYQMNLFDSGKGWKKVNAKNCR